MNLIAELIQTGLEELFQKGAIEDYQEMNMFEAECEIENYGVNEPLYMVTLCNWQIFIWNMNGKWEAYHAQSIAVGKCQGCAATYPESELKDFHGRKLCDTCRWIGLPVEVRA